MQSWLHKRALIYIFGYISLKMNFLAHSVLSPKNPLIMLGNLTGDFVKGSKFKGLHSDISKGAKLHRSIDMFTDSHQLVRSAKKIVRPDFNLFSGVVVDMIFDHFVAKKHADLKSHVDYVYKVANENFIFLPEGFKPVLVYMEKYNWLASYAQYEGLRKIMWQMRQRIGDKSPLDNAVDLLISHEMEFEKLFDAFWLDINKEFSF